MPRGNHKRPQQLHINSRGNCNRMPVPPDNATRVFHRGTRVTTGPGISAPMIPNSVNNYYNNRHQNMNNRNNHYNRNPAAFPDFRLVPAAGGSARPPNNRESVPVSTAQAMPHQGSVEYKVYVCPCCNQHYDYYQSLDIFKGRVPLVLTCQHTVCQDCIEKKIGIGASKFDCPICKFQSNLPAVYPPNFYLLGVITFYKKHQRSNFVNTWTLVTEPVKKRTVVGSSNEKCCFGSCNKPAELFCPECNDYYCDECCRVIHKSAKSLTQHKPTPNIRSEEFSVELELCSEHPTMKLEFICESCKLNTCSYCMLETHRNHDLGYMWKLEPEEDAELGELQSKAEKVLRQLLISQKKVENLIDSNNASLERQVHDFFTYCHAVLTKAEKSIIDELSKENSSDKNELAITEKTLTTSINTIKDVLNIDVRDGRQINLKKLLSKLRDVVKLPCYLLNSCSVNFNGHCDVTDSNIDIHFEVEKQDESELYLVTEDGLPLDYKKESDDEMNAMAQAKMNALIAAIKRAGEPAKGQNKQPQVKIMPKPENLLEKATNEARLRPVAKSEPNMEKVIVTHIKSMDNIYIQYKKMQNKITALNRDIHNYVSMGGQPVQCPQINELYLAFYVTKTEQLWCRGRVIEIINGETEPMYEVFFIDYGHTQTVKLDRLKEISPSLKQKKAFVVECRLYNPTNTSWNKNAHISLGKLINGKDVYMWVKNNVNSILTVDLMIAASTGGTTSVIELLIYATDNSLSTRDDESVTSSKSTSSKGTYYGPRVHVHTNNKVFKKEQKESVYIVHVVDPYNIYIHLKSYKDMFSKLQIAIKKAYKHTITESEVLMEGTFVIVEDKHPIRGSWHRAFVKSVDYNMDKVHVNLIDWGVSVVISTARVKKMQESLSKMVAQAVLVRMADVLPFNKSSVWADMSIHFLQNYVNSQEHLTMMVASTQPDLEVVFFESKGNIEYCLNALMVYHNLAESSGPLSRKVQWNDYRTNSPEFTEEDGLVGALLNKINKDTDESDAEDAEMPNKPLLRQVEIVKFIDPDSMFVKFTSNKEKEMELHKALQVCYSEERPTKDSEWEVGEMCVVAYDNRYVRGRIIKSDLNEEVKKYQVNIPDWAEETTVTHDKIYVAHDIFKKYRPVAIRCHLANLRPAGDTGKWVSSALEAVQKTFEKYRLLFVEKSEEDIEEKKLSFPVILWYLKVTPGGALEADKKKYVSINNLLVKLGFAYRKNSKPKSQNITITDQIPTDGNETALSKDDFKVVEEEENVQEEQDKRTNSDKSDIPELSDKLSVCAMDEITDWNDLIEIDSQESPEYEKTSLVIDDWLPPFRITKRSFDAWITCAETEGFLYIHDDDMEESYKTLEQNYGKYFDNNPPQNNNNISWKAGDICTIKLTDLWYRGKVLDVIDKDKIGVYMIDYGSDHIISAQDLYKEILYPNIQAFATKVKLDGVFPKSGKWLASDYDTLMREVTEYGRITVKGPLDVAVPLVDVLLQNGVVLNQRICELCPNLVRSSILPSESHDDAVVVLEEFEETEESDEIYQYDGSLDYVELPIPEMLRKDRVLMSIKTILDCDKVVLRATNANFTEDFGNMAYEINQAASVMPPMKNFKVGMPCIARWSVDKVWYRGTIHDLTESKDCVQVRFVDYGNIDIITLDDVRVVKTAWLKVPLDSFTALLNFKLIHNKDTNRVKSHMQQYCDKNEFVTVVSENPLIVDLYNNTGDLCYEDLITDGIIKAGRNSI